MLRKARLDELRDRLTAFFASQNYKMRKDKEYYFHHSFSMIFSLLSVYSKVDEKCCGQGMVDMVVETPDYVYIFEFKLNGSAESALQQIDERGYAKPYLADSRKVYKIGVKFGKKSGTIDEWKVVEGV